jgi:hypothetical protein
LHYVCIRYSFGKSEFIICYCFMVANSCGGDFLLVRFYRTNYVFHKLFLSLFLKTKLDWLISRHINYLLVQCCLFLKLIRIYNMILTATFSFTFIFDWSLVMKILLVIPLSPGDFELPERIWLNELFWFSFDKVRHFVIKIFNFGDVTKKCFMLFLRHQNVFLKNVVL